MAVNTILPIVPTPPGKKPLPQNTPILILLRQLPNFFPLDQHLPRNYHFGSSIFATFLLGRPSFQVDIHRHLEHLLPKTDTQPVPLCLRVAGPIEVI